MSPLQAPFYPRLGALATIFATMIVVLGLRVAWLSTSSAVQATDLRRVEIPAPRGTIWDRNGELVATNTYVYDVGLDLAAAEQRAELGELSARLSEALDRPADELRAKMQSAIDEHAANGAAYGWLNLATGVPMNEAKMLEDLEGQGLKLARTPKRVYPLGADTAHLTGFIYEHVDPDAPPLAEGQKPDLRGSGGIEASFDAVLQGRDGLLAGYDGTRPDDFVPALAGTDLRLTIDRDIQVAATQALSQTLADQDSESGTVIVLDVSSGAVLASTSLPSYDPNTPWSADPKRFADPAVSAIYEPGSVIKAVTLAAAIDGGAVEPNSFYQDEGTIEYAGMQIQNWDHLGHGWISMRDMMVNSLNVGAVWAATQLGRDPFYHGLRSFGFGEPTGIDLASEVEGIIHWPDEEGEAWYAGNLATNAFGQGMSATPMQVAVAIAAIANDGLLMQPYVVAEQLPVGEPPVLTEARPRRQILRPETARAMRELMQTVVDDKVTQAALPGYSVGGKTGTSQIAVEGGYDDVGSIASFVGFLPVDAPQIVILTKIDRPRGVRGSDVAAPLFRSVAEAAVAALNIPPDRPLGLVGSE